MQKYACAVACAIGCSVLTPSSFAQAPPGPPLASALGVQPLTPQVPPMPNTAVELKIEAVRPLKLQEAIAIALERNPQLLNGRIAAERAEAAVREQEAGLFPTVNASFSYTYNQLPTSKVSAALLAASSAGALSSAIAQVETAPIFGQFSIAWTAFSSGLVSSNIQAVRRSLAASRYDLERIRQEILSGVINAYYDLQNADGNVEIGEASVRSAEASLKDAQAQERAGTGTRFAVLQGEVQLANARVQLLQYQNARVVAQRNLARQLNFARPTDVTAAEPIEQGPVWQLSLEQSILEAYRNRSELPAYLAQEQAARAREEAAYASQAPQVSLAFTPQLYDNLLDRITGIFTGYSVSAQVSWSIFDGGAATARANQAAADARTARVNYIDTLNAIRYGVESAYADMLTATLRIDTTATAVESASEALRLARLRFQAGVGTQTDVITADRDLAQARVNRLTAIVDFNRSVASLRRALGTL